MASYTVDSLKKEIRVAIDMNNTSNTILATSDIDTLTLDEIIESKIEDAARIVEVNAPAYLLVGDAVSSFTSANKASDGKLDGVFSVTLPDNFLRLLRFRMTSWQAAISTAITDADPQYLILRNRFLGIRGNVEKPAAAIVMGSTGPKLEVYSSSSSSDTIAEAAYLARPVVSDGSITISGNLKSAVVYYAAYLVALTIGAESLAMSMKSISESLMR